MAQQDATIDVGSVLADDNFKQLPLNEKHKVLLRVDPDYKGLAPQEQQKVLQHIQYPEPAAALIKRQPGIPTPFEADTITAMGFDPQAISSKQGTAAQWKETGREAWQGAKTFGKKVLQDPFHIADPVEGAAGNIEKGVKERRPGLVLGGASTVAGMIEAPEAADIPEAVASGASRVKEAVNESRSLGNLKGGTEDIFRASVPGAGSKAFDLRDNVSVAASDLAEIQRRTPITGKGGVIRPDMRLRSAADNIDSYMQEELWKKQVQPQIDRWAKAQVDTKPLKQSMLDTITATDRESNPAGVRAVEKWAARMPDNDTLAGLAERRKTINAYLRDFEKSSGSEQAKAMQTKPLVEALKAQDRAIQQQMFAELRRRGEPGIDSVERRYAALAELRDAARSQMNAAESFRLLDRIGFYLNPKNLVGMHERLTVRPTSGRLMEQGMKRLEKTGLEPPPRPSQGPAPETPTNRMLPAAGETGQGGPHPALGDRAPGGPKTSLPARTGYPAANPADRGEALARVPGKSYQSHPSVATRTPPSGYSAPGPPGPAPEVEAHMAERLRSGQISRGEIMRMTRKGILGQGAATRIFKLAGRKGLPPPPPPASAP